MPNQIHTYCAIPLTETGKVHSSINKAKAILALLINDGADSDLEGFRTNEEIIRTALLAIDDYLRQAKQSSKVDFYFKKESGNETH